MKKVFFILITLALSSTDLLAQCAMCRTQLENNVSNGDIGIAAGINFGILYLFSAPYIAIGVIAFLWYKTSKRNAQKELTKRSVAG